jgi:hypothetical protein
LTYEIRKGDLIVPFPTDVAQSIWLAHNYALWKTPQVCEVESVMLEPLEAKALHVIGTLVQIFEAAGHLLYCDPEQARPYANYGRYVYLLACTAIELIGRCWNGKQNVYHSTLEAGLKVVDLQEVNVNIFVNGKHGQYTYDVSKLVALRNLIAHGQGIASANRRSELVTLHVELLDSFPGKLTKAFDDYYDHLFKSSNNHFRLKLAEAGVEPSLYSDHSGNIYQSPIKEAYKRVYKPNLKPSDVLGLQDWQIYNPSRCNQVNT